jgi:hypothetical protein
MRASAGLSASPRTRRRHARSDAQTFCLCAFQLRVAQRRLSRAGMARAARAPARARRPVTRPPACTAVRPRAERETRAQPRLLRPSAAAAIGEAAPIALTHGPGHTAHAHARACNEARTRGRGSAGQGTPLRAPAAPALPLSHTTDRTGGSWKMGSEFVHLSRVKCPCSKPQTQQSLDSCRGS